jgi:2-polyprenyl-6-hydroxyphenyl methylase/3-demethylubiquinone-9 3-methyltransferase
MNAGEVHADLPAKLRRPSEAARLCKACGQPAPLFGVTDFNRSCETARGLQLPRSGVAIAYYRCSGCGLLFTDAFDDWSPADFATHIYNAAYPQVDPGSVETRPATNAEAFARRFAPFAAELSILDYGGGNGRFAEGMRAAGFDCVTYDPMQPGFAVRPTTRFRLVTCFETMEHLPDPAAGAADIAALLAEDGAVLFSTLVQPPDFEQVGMGWWYIGPRNGHITLFSPLALATVWRRAGLSTVSLNDDVHLAFRDPPPAFLKAAFPPTAPG